MNLKEQFFVTRVLIELPEPEMLKSGSIIQTHSSFSIRNPNDGLQEPPIFDSYKEAEEWIKNNGAKYKYYQIQKFIMPTP